MNEDKLAILNGRSAFNKHNGIRVVELGEDYAVVEGELRSETMNPWGMAHGGFVYSLCDVAAGVAAGRLKRRCVTLNGSMHYLRPSVGTKLRAVGRIIKDGSSIVVVQTDVYSDGDTHTARGEFELFITGEKK